MAESDFTAEDAVKAQKALRDALGLGAEAFPLPAFIGMLSDEMEQLYATGRSDSEIAEMITAATGKPIDFADIARFYASAADRGKG